jgi:glycosyltransferase involved in cell wall biosynthesis
MDALCLPSYREGVPRSVIEGLASGRPVLATDIRGSRELVLHEDNGYLAKPGDVQSLASGLRWLFEHSAGDFALMGQRARASVDPERRESHVFARLLDAYQG